MWRCCAIISVFPWSSKGERVGVIELRKHYSGFLRGMPHVSKIRNELMQFTEAEPILEHLTRFLELYSPGSPEAAVNVRVAEDPPAVC